MPCLVASSVVGAIGAVIFVLLVFAFSESVTAWLGKAARLVGPRAIEVVVGAPLVLFAGWGLWRAMTGKSSPDLSERQRIIALSILVALGLLGAGLLVAAIAQP